MTAEIGSQNSPLSALEAATPTGPKPDSESASMTARATFAQQTHDYVREQIKFADQKAAFLFAASSALLAILYNKDFYQHWLDMPADPSSIISFVAMCSLILAAALAGGVVVPRRKGSSRGYIFWASIAAHTTSSEYVAAVAALSDRDLTSEKLHHCHELARICQRKYAWLDRGLWIGTIGAAASLLCLALPS